MGFSINPVDFLNMMSERHKISRQQVIDWLECVRADGRLLSDTWLEITDQFHGAPSDEKDELAHALREQKTICLRLDTFYAQASSVIEGRLQTNYWDGFMDRLGGALKARGKARHMTNEFANAGTILCSHGRKVREVDTIMDAIEELQKELADLDVFIQAIKSSPKAIR